MFRFISYLKKIFLIFLLNSIMGFTYVNAKVYDEIIVVGNERLSVETILMFSGLKLGQDINESDLNLSIKKLYKTDYFKNIKFSSQGEILKIEIVENPIIQTIKIEGIKNKSLLKQLFVITKKSEKYPYLKKKVRAQKNLLLNSVRASGFYFAEISN